MRTEIVSKEWKTKKETGYYLCSKSFINVPAQQEEIHLISERERGNVILGTFGNIPSLYRKELIKNKELVISLTRSDARFFLSQSPIPIKVYITDFRITERIRQLIAAQHIFTINSYDIQYCHFNGTEAENILSKIVEPGAEIVNIKIVNTNEFENQLTIE